MISFSISRWPVFYPSIAASKSRVLVYSLNEVKDRLFYRAYLSGSVKRNLSWVLSVNHYQFDYDKINYIYTLTDTTIIRLDDAYEVANASIDYNFSNKIGMSNGLGVSTYSTGSRYSNLSFYSNLKYEFRKECFLYLGYKTGQSQDEPIEMDNLTGHFIRNSASAYLKISAEL